MSTTRTFKKTDPAQVKANANKPRTGGFITPFVNTEKVHKWRNGSNLLRLLPQLDGSQYGCFCEYYKFGLYGGNIEGNFAIEPDSAVSKLIYDVSKTLRAHPEHKFNIKSFENENGVSINTSPRVAFLGFDFETPENGVKVIDLPGTFPVGSNGKAHKEGAGTRITKFIYDQDIHGKIKYGDIFDTTTGRVIAVDVVNAGTVRAVYTPTIDAEFAVTDTYSCLLDEVDTFDKFIDFKTVDQVKAILRQYLPKEMVDDVLQLND